MSGDEARLGETRRQHNAFLKARLVLVSLFVGLWFLLAVVGYPMPYGFFVVLLAEAAALLAFVSLVAKAGSHRELKLLHYALLGFELVCHTAMVYILGGLSWLGPVAYIYALMYASVFLSLAEAALFTVLVAAVYMALVTLDGTGTIPHQWYLAQGPDRYRDTAFLVTTSVAFVGVLATVTFWMVFIGNEMRRERDVAIKANDELLLAQKDLRELNEELEKKVEERTRALTWRAEHDTLTGLLNRSSIARRCQELLALGRRGGRSLSIVGGRRQFQGMQRQRGPRLRRRSAAGARRCPAAVFPRVGRCRAPGRRRVLDRAPRHRRKRGAQVLQAVAEASRSACRVMAP
jgi:hypothetical protein